MPVRAGDAAGVAVLGTAAGEVVGMAGTPAPAAGDDTGKAAVTAELTEKLNTITSGGQGASRPIRANHYLQKMTSTDDVEAYLKTFERTAERERWPENQWADLVAPFLSGDAQKAYYDLEARQAGDYNQLKTEILARLGVTPAVRAQRFHSWGFQLDKPPRSQMYDLIHLSRKWLKPEVNSAAEVVQLVVMDRFLRGLPPALRRWVGQGDPTNADQLVALVERYLATNELVRPAPHERPQNLKARSLVGTGKTVAGSGGIEDQPLAAKGLGDTWDIKPGQGAVRPGGKIMANHNKFIRCFRCQELGHIAVQCPGGEEPMQCNVGEKITGVNLSFCNVVTGLTGVQVDDKHLCTVSIDGNKVKALLDSGSMVTLVSTHLVEANRLDQTHGVSVTCIHGDTHQYPTANLCIDSSGGPVSCRVGVVAKLPYEVILGRDFPNFFKLWYPTGHWFSGHLSLSAVRSNVFRYASTSSVLVIFCK
ncbi:UNVERIFIED_CONTAM: hypothetical protein FKN15_034635 [Acipenser sinensis]